MADISSEDIHKLTEAMASLNRTVLKSSKLTGTTQSNRPTPSGSGSHGDSAVIKKLIDSQNKLSLTTNSLSTGVKKASDASMLAAGKFNEFSAAANNATRGLTTVSRIFGAGGVLLGVTKSLDETKKTYQEMTAVGQSFGGSMLSMQIAAANAALPLDQFADVIKKNSVVMATLGTKPFFEMSKALRNSLVDVGQLGMTTMQLNSFMGQYMETQRLYGNFETMSSDKSVSAMKMLAVETQKAAQMTGMNREAIMQGSANAMRDETIRAKMMMMNSNSSMSFGTALGTATTYMSALPGEAGKTLSVMLAQSIGRGSAILSDSAQTFIDAGMFGITDMMDNMAKKVASGNFSDKDQVEFNKKFVAEGMKNMSSLQFQASTGNQAARQAIVMISEMRTLANKGPEEIAKQSKITNFMLNFSQMIDNISGKIRGSFFKGLENFMTGFEKFSDSPAFGKLVEKIERMASRFGTFLGETLTPERLIAFGSGVASAAEVLSKFVLGVMAIVEKTTAAFGWLSDKLGVFGASVATIAAFLTAKFAISKIGGLLSETFKIGGNDAQKSEEGFARALARYAAGRSLRVQMNPGGRAGNLEERVNRRNTRRPPPGDPIPPESRGQRLQRRLNNFGERGAGFRARASNTIGQALRHPIRTSSAGMRRGLSSGATWAKRGLGATARVGRAAKTGVGSVMKGAGSIAKGIGPGAIAGAAVATALAFAPDFKGKATLQAMAEYGAMGSMLGPIGGAIGVGVGAIVANWDDLSTMMSDGFGAIAGFDYSGAFKTAASFLTPIGGAMAAGGQMLQSAWTSIGDHATNTFADIKAFKWQSLSDNATSLIAPIAEQFNKYASGLSNIWSSIATAATSSLKSLSGPSASAVGGVLTGNLFDTVFTGFNNMLNGNNLSAPSTPKSVVAPEINTDTSAAVLADLKSQMLQVQKDNSTLRNQIAKLMEAINQGTNNTTGGLRDLIGEQRKGNQNLGTIAGNII